jgi:hypothetical protein
LGSCFQFPVRGCFLNLTDLLSFVESTDFGSHLGAVSSILPICFPLSNRPTSDHISAPNQHSATEVEDS